MNFMKLLKKYWWTIPLAVVVIALVVYLSIHFSKEKFGYSQNIDRNYTDLTFADRERHSVELPGQLEGASDMPEATASYTNPDLAFL